MHIFGIHLENLARAQVLLSCQTWLSGDDFRRVSTVNPEFLLRAKNDALFAKNLHQADLRVIDGFGIVVALWLRGESVTRLAGADLTAWLLAHAQEHDYRIFVAVRENGLSSYAEIRAALLKKYPRLRVSGQEMDVTSPWDPSEQRAADSELLAAHIVLCNFGAPEQEYFTEHLRKQPGSIRLAMGVGGSFDYLTGKLRRAPLVLRSLGLEWLWRLTQQPKRLSRIWRATGVFLYESLRNK